MTYLLAIINGAFLYLNYRVWEQSGSKFALFAAGVNALALLMGLGVLFLT